MKRWIAEIPGWLELNRVRMINLVLMTASGGIDGVYLGKMMESRDGRGILFLGLLLNFAADYANQELSMWFGRFLQGTKVQKRLSWLLVPFILLTIGYSWLFSWRQLRPQVYLVEISPVAAKIGASVLAQVIEVELLAFAFAGFVPILITGLSLVDGIRAGRFRLNQTTTPAYTAKSESGSVPSSFQCGHCERTFSTQQAVNGHQSAHSGNGHKVIAKEAES